MLVFVPLIIGLIILVTWTTAPSRNVSSADEAFKSGHIRKAEEYLKKVWTRRDDIPAHYAGMLFKLIKKGKLAYVKEAFNISQDGLSEDAKYHLKGVQKEIQKYIEDNGYELISAEFTRLPNVELKELEGEDKADIEKLIERIEEDDDVQNVYTTMKP